MVYFAKLRTFSSLKYFISKRKVIPFIILLFSILVLFKIIHPTWEISNTNLTLLKTNREPNESSSYKCCTEMNNPIRTNVYFLKTHKTGGTTVQSIIMRFAMVNNLDVMCITYATYYWPLSDLSIYAGTTTPNNKYHILASHMRYDTKLKSYQYPDTSMVTILRNPATLFESLYTFFRMDQTTGLTFQKFLNAPVKPSFVWGLDSAKAYRGYNQMSMDLGFNLAQSKNNTAIAEFIAKIDREFDLVMITEYMEESSVLLANLMGWPLDYVAFLKLNSRLNKTDGYSMTLQDEITLLDLNPVDAMLYHYFLDKFRKCVQQYGVDRMNTQVQQLRILNEKLKNRCVENEVVGFNIGLLKRLEYKIKNKSDLACVYSVHLSPTIESMVGKAQAKKHKIL